MLFEILKAIVLGIVEGLTEWLPISSTGHMILVDEFIHLQVSDGFKELFLVVIQLGAILAVVTLYFRKLWPLTRQKNRICLKKDTLQLWGKVIVGVIPAAVMGFLFDDLLETYLYNSTVVALMLILYGVLFLVVERWNRNRTSAVTQMGDLSYRTALLIGCFQVLSLIPGTSRSGATILGALLLGTSRYVAAEFSFFLAIPVMFGASLLKIVKFGFSFTGSELVLLLVGMVVAYVVSILAIRGFVGYLKRKDFKVFGIYRIVLGILVLAYFALVR